jgi:DNA-binding CsgD family transcriptional regulator
LLVWRSFGYSSEELARRFGITENNVNVFLCRARQNARLI